MAALAGCEARLSLGSGCARRGECASGLDCVLGRCREECLTTADCPLGERCIAQPGSAYRACSQGRSDRCDSAACSAGLVCSALGECVNACGGIVDCPDRVCEAGACVPSRATGDAGVADAGVPPVDPTCRGGPCGTALDVCVGDGYACAVRADHAILCWGSNENGALGDGVALTTRRVHEACGTVDCASEFVRVVREGGTPLSGVHVACAAAGACAIDDAGAVWCWGAAYSGGTGSPSPPEWAYQARVVPGLPAGTSVAQIHAARGHFCAQLSSGEVWCWGEDLQGAMGLGAIGVAMRSPSHVAVWDGGALSLGSDTTCALMAGRIRCAGTDEFGELGPNGTLGTPTGTPVEVTFPGASGVPTALATGIGFGCALVDDTAWCWGWGGASSLGRGTVTYPCGADVCDPVPAPVDGRPALVRLWAEGYSDLICGQTAAGETTCWGSYRAEDCNWEAGACDVPGVQRALDGIVRFAGGYHSSCAIAAGGTLSCSGSNTHGERGGGEIDAPGAATHPAFDPVCLLDTCR